MNNEILEDIENIMERWNLGRLDDIEALDEINNIFFDAGKLTFFK